MIFARRCRGPACGSASSRIRQLTSAWITSCSRARVTSRCAINVGLRLAEAASACVQARQGRQGLGGRPQNLCRRWQGQPLVGKRFASLGEHLRSHRYEAPAAGSVGSLMHMIATTMQHDLARPHLDAVPDRRGVVLHWQRNEHQLRREPDERDARHVFLAAHQSQPARVDPGDARSEIAMIRQNEVKARSGNTPPEVVRVGESRCPTPSHRLPLCRTIEATGSARRASARQTGEVWRFARDCLCKIRHGQIERSIFRQAVSRRASQRLRRRFAEQRAIVD